MVAFSTKKKILVFCTELKRSDNGKPAGQGEEAKRSNYL